jgi:putative peptidoglycan lipid II flippase
MASRILGLIREQVFAALFGAGLAYDAFTVAFRIPNLLRDLFAEGALSSAFVTTFTQWQVEKGEEAAWRLANLVLNTLTLLLGGIAFLGILFSDQIVSWMAPRFEDIPGKVALTVKLTQIMFPFLPLISLAAVAMGILNTKDRFGIPASASTFFNVGSILVGVSCVYLMPYLGQEPIVGMALGTLAGGLLQFFIQIPSLYRVGFRYQPIISFSDPGIRQIMKLIGPAIIGQAAVQINVFINTYFASTQQSWVSWLNYAFRLMQFPIGVFGVAIATATLPAISRSAARQDMDEFRQTLASSLGLVFLLTIPASFGLIVLGSPIICLIYEHGRFTSFDTQETAGALAFYAIGLSAYAGIKVLVPAFYALKDTQIPMRVSLISIVNNILLNWLLIQPLGHRGLALSTSLMAIFNFTFLISILRYKLKGIHGRILLRSFSKIIAASSVMATACWITRQSLAGYLHSWGLLGNLIWVSLSILVSVGLFYAACRVLQVEELEQVMTVVKAKIKR